VGSGLAINIAVALRAPSVDFALRVLLLIIIIIINIIIRINEVT